MIKKIVFSGFVGGLVAGLFQLANWDIFYLIQTIFASIGLVSPSDIDKYQDSIAVVAAIFVGLIFLGLWIVASVIIAFLGKVLKWDILHYQRAWIVWGCIFLVWRVVERYLSVKKNPYYDPDWFVW